MDPGSDASGAGEAPSSSTRAGADGEATPPPAPAAAAEPPLPPPQQQQQPPPPPSRYESQKRRDWNTFLQYLKSHKPPLSLPRCSGAHVIEFLKYLDQFGKTKVHAAECPYFGHPTPPAPCACPLKQAWGSLDALIGRLRAAFEENGGRPESNPFAARAVRIYLRDVRESQAKARGIPYKKTKRKRNNNPAAATQPASSSSGGGGGGEGESASTANVTIAASATVAPTTSEAAEGSRASPPQGDSSTP